MFNERILWENHFANYNEKFKKDWSWILFPKSLLSKEWEDG